MDWLIILWSFLVKWSTKAWEGIKKLSGWAVIALLILFAIIVHLVKANRLQKRRAEAQERLKDIQIEYTASKVEASAKNESEVKSLKAARDEARDELEIVETEINEASEKGAVGIANEWKSFLGGRKSDD